MKPVRLATLATLVLAGCGISPKPPSWVKWVPATPPSEKAEFVAEPDDPTLRWQTGQWARKDDQWAWQPGSFTEPPSRNAAWVPGCWIEKDGQWTWVEGTWR